MSRLTAVLLAAGLCTATVSALRRARHRLRQPAGRGRPGPPGHGQVLGERWSRSAIRASPIRSPSAARARCRPAPAAGRATGSGSTTSARRCRPARKCTAKLRPEWKPSVAASGPAAAAPLAGPREFAFSTGGPAIVSMQPGDGAEIEEDQHFLIRLNGPAVEASVLANARCEVEGIGERLPLVLLGGEQRAQLLKARRIAPGAVAAAADRALRAAARQRRGASPGLGQGHRRRRQSAGGDDDRAALPPARARRLHGRVQLRAREGGRALPADPADEPALLGAGAARAGGAGAARAGERRGARAGVRQGRQGGRGDRDRLSQAAGRERGLQRRPAARAEGQRRPAARQRRELSAQGRHRRGAADRQVRGGAVRRGRAPCRCDAAGDPAPCAGRAARRRAARPSAPAATSAGQVRVKRLQSDAEILAWYAKLQKYHETQLTAEELGLPKSQWFTTEDDVDAKGRPIKRKVERRVGTREVSLLGSDAGAKRLELPQLAGGDPRPFEVVGLPLAEPGYHVVEIESLRLGQALLDKRAPMYVRTGVLVTNLGVHFKLGRENSVVWVTTLDRGKPVEGADDRGQRLHRQAALDRAQRRQGPGGGGARARCEPRPLPRRRRLLRHRAQGRRRKGGATDVAFVFSSWQKGIESWRFNVPTGRGAEPDLRAATVFDRTLLRAGETVSMKHFIRTETGDRPGRGAAGQAADDGQAGAPGQRPGVQLSRCSGAAAAAAPPPPGTFRPRPSSASTRSRSSGPRRPMPSRAPAARARATARRGSAAGRAATSGSRSSACRWSTRACPGRRRCRSRRRASPSTCR